MNNNPKVSVVTVVLNQKDCILDCIKSVSNQSYLNIEHVIIDGGSKDGTLEKISSLANGRIKVILSDSGGLYEALNKGINNVTGEIVGILHGDDFYAHQDVIAKVVGHMVSGGFEVVYGDLEYVRQLDTARVVRYWKAGSCSSLKLNCGWAPPHPTIFCSRSVYDKHGCFDTKFNISSDYDFIIKIFSDSKLKFSYIPEVLVKMRLGGVSNRSLSCVCRKSLEDYMILKKNKIPFPVVPLLLKNFTKIKQFWARRSDEKSI